MVSSKPVTSLPSECCSVRSALPSTPVKAEREVLPPQQKDLSSCIVDDEVFSTRSSDEMDSSCNSLNDETIGGERRNSEETFESLLARKTGADLVRTLSAMLKRTPDEKAGDFMWAAVGKAYFGSLSQTQLKRNADNFAEVISDEFLDELGQYSLDDMETKYLQQLKTVREEVMEHFWDLYSAMNGQWPAGTSKPMALYPHNTEFRKVTTAYIEHIHAHPPTPHLDVEDCAVCRLPDPSQDNHIVICSGCSVFVHQRCYNVPVVPEGDWLCRPCLAGVAHPTCVICLCSKGAMIQSEDHQWGHVSCVSLLPKANISPSFEMDLSNVNHELGCCTFCKEYGGLFMSCDHEKCDVQFHPECWRLWTRSSHRKQRVLCLKHMKGLQKSRLLEKMKKNDYTLEQEMLVFSQKLAATQPWRKRCRESDKQAPGRKQKKSIVITLRLPSN